VLQLVGKLLIYMSDARKHKHKTLRQTVHEVDFVYKTKHFIVLRCLKSFTYASIYKKKKKDALFIDFNNCLQLAANPCRMLLTSRPIYYTHSFVLTPIGHR